MYEHHPAADAFPLMDKKRYSELLEDIKRQGQIEEITLCEGMVLDGRNRYKACVELGIEPKVREFVGDPWQRAWSLNGERRDLSEMQRGAIKWKCDQGSEKHAKKIADMNKSITDEANKKRSEAAKEGKVGRASTKGADSLVGVHNEHPLKRPERPGRAARAKEANVSSSTQARVEYLANNNPELIDKVASGEMKPAEAMRQVKRDRVSKDMDAPTGKYRVIYADPPWSYGNTQPDYQTEQADHYPVMKMSEICALPIKDIAEDDAVLFLWVTSPILAESFAVVKAWGFKYKAAFIWDKIKHNMGHYNSVRHEILLICVRGSCQPDERKLFDSVQSIERTKHSEKPEQFRTIIDTIYPDGKRVELFARTKTEGWDAWGNQS